MKFGYGRVARLEHFYEELGREDLEVVRLDAIREAVHGLSPGPKTVAGRQAVLGIARHAPLKRVAVRVRQAGDHDSVDPLEIVRGTVGCLPRAFGRGFDRCDMPVVRYGNDR